MPGDVLPLRGPGGTGAARLVAEAYTEAARERELQRAQDSAALSALCLASTKCAARLLLIGRMLRGDERAAVLEAAQTAATMALKLAARAQALLPSDVDTMSAGVAMIERIAREMAAQKGEDQKGQDQKGEDPKP